MFLVVTNQEIMDVLQSLNNKSIWETIIIVVTPVAASIITLWISNKHAEKQLKIQLQNERKNEQIKVVLDTYKELKALESWGTEGTSIDNLEKMEDELSEVDGRLQLNEFYIPNKIYSEIYNIKEEWSHISDEYDKYLKSKKGNGPYYVLNVDEKVHRLVAKRKDLRDMIKKEFGYL